VAVPLNPFPTYNGNASTGLFHLSRLQTGCLIGYWWLLVKEKALSFLLDKTYLFYYFVLQTDYPIVSDLFPKSEKSFCNELSVESCNGHGDMLQSVEASTPETV
jgi:hypothetical protein